MIKLILTVLILIQYVRSKKEPGDTIEAIFQYPSDGFDEERIRRCSPKFACNIVSQRFWLPALVERLCECPSRQECPWRWTDKSEKNTMLIDNRSQLKFCEEMEELPTCNDEEIAIEIAMIPLTKDEYRPRNGPQHRRNKGQTKKLASPKNVTALCNCKQPHYWTLRTSLKHNEYVHKTYTCSKLQKCKASEFCGYARKDTHSVYYTCSCPEGHMCISKDKKSVEVDEMLYKGKGYKAFCLPKKNKSG